MTGLAARATTAIGIDVGGTSVKGGVVRVATGEVVGSIGRRPTPRPAHIGDV